MTLPRLLTVDELAAELWPDWDAKGSRRWVYRQLEERGLPSMKLGRQVVLDSDAVRRWLDAQRCGDNYQHPEEQWAPETAEAVPTTATAPPTPVRV